MTFKESAAIFMQEKVAQNKWSNKAHIDQWETSIGLKPTKMLCTVSETFANLPVANIDQDDVLALLEPMWHEPPVSASRLRNLIETVLINWTANNKIADRANPAAWKRMKECGLIAPEEIKEVVPRALLPHSKVVWGDFKSRQREEGTTAWLPRGRLKRSTAAASP
jgi:hypothetical protein